MLFFLALMGCVQGPIGGPGPPEIHLVDVPAAGFHAYLHGSALHIDPREYAVAVLLWDAQTAEWVSSSPPTVPVRADGSWSVDVSEPGEGPLNERFIATLVSRETTVEPVRSALLPELFEGLPQDGLLRTVGGESRLIQFSQRAWAVRAASELSYPGPNLWEPDAVSVDADGQLHLALLERGEVGPGCSEVQTVDPLGWGTYRFVLETPPVLESEHLTLGLFVRDSVVASDVNELDIELSRWSAPMGNDAQFAVQPWEHSGNVEAFTLGDPGGRTTHTVVWTPESLSFTIAAGDIWPPAEADVLRHWDYPGADHMQPGDDRVHISFWLFRYADPDPSAWLGAEAVVTSFDFVPL